jgi:cytosine/adenosine deaminase-related metal-dependent hydrolase
MPNPNTPTCLIRGAAGIMTGASGAAARHAGPDIRIRGARIEAIGALEALAGERVIDAAGCMVYPAWVNTHHHLAESLLKGLPAGINCSLSDWLVAVPLAYRGRFDEEALRVAARIGLLELLLSGCGTVADHNFVNFPAAGFDSAAILFEEATALGLRFVLCRGASTLARPKANRDPRDRWGAEPFETVLRSVERAVATFHDPSDDAFRRVVMAPTTPLFEIEPGQLRECAQAGRALGIRLHTHLSETVRYAEFTYAKFGCSPVEFAARHDWLGPDVWFAHLVKLEAHEIALLGSTGTGMAHCPQSNARLGSGIAPAVELERAGARVSLGVDGAGSNEAADMISEVHAAWHMQRAREGQLARPGYDGGTREGGGGAVTVEDVIRWGTAGGADVLGFAAGGRLVPGALADIAIYRLDEPRYLGLHDRALGPVVSGGRPFLRALMVGGKVVAENDRVPGLDLDELAARARSALARLAH